MTILEAIEEVAGTLLPVPEFFYADLFEANVDADLLANSAFPIMIVLPISPTDNPGKSGVLKSSLPFSFFMLNVKTDQATVQYNSIQIENEIIAPMRALARQFMFNLNRHAIIDPETAGATNIKYDPTYNALDRNCYGVFVTAQVPFMEKITGCH
jgi:hypothetical protein